MHDTPLPDHLRELGDALRAAAAADLTRAAAAPARPTRRPVRRQVRRRRLVTALAVAVVAVPGAAIAADMLISNGDVAKSIPQGTLALLNTHPTCTTVRAGVEFDCTLATAPSADGGPAAGQWLHTVEPTVDAAKRVNGGCRSENAAGTHWRCYVGQAAVDEQIIGSSFLGVSSPSPGVG